MITANCRARFTARDFEYIVRVLSRTPGDKVSLSTLLSDEQARDVILDDERLASEIFDSPERLSISPQFYFYVLCRHVLLKAGISCRDVADYVSSLLETFSRTSRLHHPEGIEDGGLHYLSDMLQALSKAGPREAFLLRAHIANYALFLSGIFADYIERRRRRGAPGLSFYEGMGRTHYHTASLEREAGVLNLSAIFHDLAEGFREVRMALNDLACRLLHLDSPQTLQP